MDEAPGAVVVVVGPPTGAVVLVDTPPVVVVVEEELAPGVVVVVEVVDVGVGAGAGADGLTRLFNVVPVSAPPKMLESGLPEMSSIAVMSSNASTNTVTALMAMARQEKPAPAGRATAGWVGLVEATSRSVAGADAPAETSRRPVSSTGAAVDDISVVSASSSWPAGWCTTSVGADASTDDVTDGPLTPVLPSLRSNVDVSGTRTATCLTAS